MVLLFTLLLFGAPAVEAREAPQAVQRIISAMAEGELPALWDHAAELAALGQEAVSSLQLGLASESVNVRLGCAKALLSLGEREPAEKALREVADSRAPAETRAAALILLRGTLDESLAPVIQRIAQKDPEPLVRIEAARTLWEVSEESAALARKLLEGFIESSDKSLRDRAALALGDIGYVAGPTKRILAQLSQEPTPLGTQAALVLRIERMARKEEVGPNPFNLPAEALVKEKDQEIEELQKELDAIREGLWKGEGIGDPLLSWIRATVRENYVEDVEKKGPNEVALRIGAAKGMVEILDPFSSFMDVKETQEFTENISGSYTGIGAQISQDRDTGVLTITRPLANGPAGKAKLKPGDLIVEIDGKPAKGRPMSLIVRWLKGEPGSQVKLKVARRGWKEPREFTIFRSEIKVENMHWRLLPAGIAYLRPENFGETTHEDVKDALERLANGPGGMQAIILDLRGNSGGLLNAAVSIVDLFVGEDVRPIVTQKGRIGVKEEKSCDIPPQYLTENLVILIDKRSASASEIVAGALQDFDQRALLVGEKTFGKGSVQRVFPAPGDLAPLLGGRAALRLTVQYYYLPSGRCIHTRRDADGAVIEAGGVAPDIKVSQLSIPLSKAEEFQKLIEGSALEEYVQQLLADRPDNRDLEVCKELLLNGDGGDPTRYPGFNEFYGKIKGSVRLEPEDVRLILRSELKRAYENDQGSELACDFQDDRQLKRAILEILKRLRVDARAFPAYASFAGEFDKETGEEAIEGIGNETGGDHSDGLDESP